MFNRKSVIALMLAALLAVMGIGMSACGNKKSDLKVGFVYIGPVDDGGYTQAHNNGRLEMMKNLNLSEEDAPYIENVKDDDPAATRAAIQSLIDAGCKMIFTTSFGYGETTKVMAEENPDLYFAHCSGSITTTNMDRYFGRMYQARYLSGIAAGKATKTNKIGYVAAFPIPEVIRGLNAFTLGVRSVNPDAQVQVVWTNTWYDENKEYQAAKALLEGGCDVLGQHQDSAQAVIAAKEKGAYSVGYNNSMLQYNEEGYLTTPTWDWGVYYTKAVQSVMDGTFKGNEAFWLPMSDGIVGLGEYGASVSEETKTLIAAEKAKIEKGEWDVFWGPIKDQTGKVVVAEGTKMSDDEIWGMMWLVEGVIGEVK
nr:BMP family ABC transporter substrate-binding protein [bacterium]